MKRGLVSALVVFLGVSAWVYADEVRPSVNDRVLKMTKELNLTEAQGNAIKPIVTEYVTKCQKVLEEAQGEALVDHTALKSALMVLKEDENRKLAKVLTEDQMSRWVYKENLRAALNKGGGDSQAGDDISVTADGIGIKF
jgi:phosphoglycerate-specific signal transduction histidine kinase